MVKETENTTRSSAYITPLAVLKAHSRDSSASSYHKRNTSSRSSSRATRSSHSQITPPSTPNGSREDLAQQMETPAPVFHNFLRAFYPFNPTYAIADSTVTLPLNEGDVILVHSIHTNGWADGTLLSTGARGWLPTNYCEAYEPEQMRNLLKALLNLWDLLRSGLAIDSEVLGNQEFMRGMIAGVRYLLETSNCLLRDGPIVASNETIRRNRKALLSDLSSLVKTAKKVQEQVANAAEHQMHPEYPEGDRSHVSDEMIFKAFRIVTRGVRFMDNLEEDIRTRQQTAANRNPMATVAEEAVNPFTPPADSMSFARTQHADAVSETASRRSSSRSSGSGVSTSQRADEQTKRKSQSHSHKRVSNAYSSTTSSRPISYSSTVNVNRQSVSHRVSLTASIPAAQRQNLVSERLNSSHDTFLSYLGSFIGRLHLQSQSSADLFQTIRQSVTAGRALLAVVEAVCGHDSQSAQLLERARIAMYDQVNKLVLAARDMIRSTGTEEDDVVMPQQNGRLLMAATGCVKAAGECVAKTKFVIERIGDFEFESSPSKGGLGIDPAAVGIASNDTKEQPSSPARPISRAPPPPLVIPNYDEKPLPSAPTESTSPSTLQSVVEGEVIQDVPIRNSQLPPLPTIASPLLMAEDYSPSDHSTGNDSDFPPPRIGSIAVSTGTNSSYLSGMRDSESSLMSQTSTRAATPDMSDFVPKAKLSIGDLSFSGSHTTLGDDADEGELKMLEKTFANELLHNKEGQITGGTLPALVERLTTHDSTPDAMFVSTFYLTFRLFATPTELAAALVDRFTYVAESPHIAGPVRLRVYNIFKGWLESHWRDSSDSAALDIIEPFARNQLGKILPSAGKRLLELAEKVSESGGTLVPRLVSSMGKTSTALAQYVPADTPLPPPIMSKSQIISLKNWKMGGSNPTILDFDPLELARQLTIKEMAIFCAILPEELLGSEWTKRSASNAMNVRAMSTLSTDLSNLVADTILQHDDAKKRAVIIKHWIKIAQKCLELNNYDSLMAVICSLNSSTIIRLKKTWDIVSLRRKEMLRALQSVVESDRNYATLRRRLQDHVSPCLPFVGTYLTDLTFVDAGNPSTKQLPGSDGRDGMSVINFGKHAQTAKIIGELQRFQIPYRLTEVPELQEWIQAQIIRVKSTSEDENVQQYYRKSLMLEPREAPLHPRYNPSPVEPNSAHSKDKFDIFGWAHSSKDRHGSVSTATSESTV